MNTSVNTLELRNRAQILLQGIHNLEVQQAGVIQSREKIEKTILDLKERAQNDREALDIATHAIEILRQVSDESVGKAYEFLEKSLNTALAKMFENSTRKIKIKEWTRSNQYPQLELELEVGNGVKRSLKTDSGHGIAQVVSLLSILSLIVITKSRRILVMDEVLSGLSVHNRKVVNDILWSFTEIGFQFIINEHGFIPAGSNVHHLEVVGDVSSVKQKYIATTGVYMQGGANDKYDYSLKSNERVGGNVAIVSAQFDGLDEPMYESEEAQVAQQVVENITVPGGPTVLDI